MQINIQSRHFTLTPALNEFIQAKIRLHFGRFEQKLMRIEVSLQDINGPKGGEDKSCKIVVKPINSKVLVVEEVADDMYDAIQSCAKRIKRSVKRNLSLPRWDRVKPIPSTVLQE